MFLSFRFAEQKQMKDTTKMLQREMTGDSLFKAVKTF